MWHRKRNNTFHTALSANGIVRKLFQVSPSLLYHGIILSLCLICVNVGSLAWAQDQFTPGVLRLEDEGTALTRRPTLNFTGSGVACTDDSSNNETDCDIGATGDITSVGDVGSGAAFDGTQGTTLTFNNASGDQTIKYDDTTKDFLISDDATFADTSPFVELCDESDSTAVMFHYDTAETPSGLSLYKGTNTSCTTGFTQTGNLMHFNSSDEMKLSSLSSSATQCLQASTTGVISGTGSACGAGGSEWTDTGTVLHPTDSSGTLDNVVVGGTTVAGADIILNVDGSVALNEQSLSTGDLKWESDTNDPMLFGDASENCLAINQSTCAAHTLAITGHIGITRTASEADQHALEINADAAGFGDLKALEIRYDVGAISDGEVAAAALIEINQIDATGGDAIGLEILATDGAADNVVGIKIGAELDVILQDSGSFADPSLATNDTNTTDVPNMRDGSTGTSTTIFVLDDDFIIIGADAAFTEMEFVIETGFGNPGIKPVFAYSTSGTNQFTNFVPTDGTDGFKSAGAFVVAWDADEVSSPAHVADDVTMKFDIRITRTANPSGSVSLFYAKSAATVVFKWDKNGDLIVNSVSLEDDGVKISGDNDGAITFLGLGDGSDEDVTLNLDDTANTGVWTSSTGLNKMDFAAIGIELNTDINITLGSDTIDFNSTTNDFEFSDDITITDTTPHFKLIDSTAGDGDWELDGSDDQFILWGEVDGTPEVVFSLTTLPTHTRTNNALLTRTAGFICPAGLSTNEDCEESRLFIPANCTLDRIELAVTTAPVGSAIIVDVNECDTDLTCTTIDTGTKPQIADGAKTGGDGTLTDTVLARGNYLGIDLDQVGSSTAGSDLTVNVICLF